MGFNVNDLKKSKYITQKDVDPPIELTIVGSKEANMALDGADPDYQWTLLFKEIDKPFVVNSTNGQLIQAITGLENSDGWVGKKIVLYVDRTVSFRGKITGGVRCRAPEGRNIPEPDKSITNPDYVGDNPPPPPDDDIPY